MDGILFYYVKGSMKSFRPLPTFPSALQRRSRHPESKISCITLSTNRWRKGSMKRRSKVTEGAGEGLASGLLLQTLLHFVSLTNSCQTSSPGRTLQIGPMVCKAFVFKWDRHHPGAEPKGLNRSGGERSNCYHWWQKLPSCSDIPETGK